MVAAKVSGWAPGWGFELSRDLVGNARKRTRLSTSCIRPRSNPSLEETSTGRSGQTLGASGKVCDELAIKHA